MFSSESYFFVLTYFKTKYASVGSTSKYAGGGSPQIYAVENKHGSERHSAVLTYFRTKHGGGGSPQIYAVEINMVPSGISPF